MIFRKKGKPHPARKDVVEALLTDMTTESDLVEIIPAFCTTVQRLASNSWVVTPDTFDAFEHHGFHLTRNHYYSVIPDVSRLPHTLWPGKHMEEAFRQASHQDDAATLLTRYLKHSAELRDITSQARAERFYWDNGLFPPLDAMVYYGIIREHKPRQIVEIGAGFSSEVALRALAENEHGALTCIEPYPSARLTEKVTAPHRLLAQGIEDASPELVTNLASGDILFVDTSHTVKIGSDVNYILFNLVPLLKPGVLVHFHDIFIPYEYPKEWIQDLGLLWNEQYLLLAFLMFNNEFEVVLSNYSASIDQRTRLEAQFEDYDIWNLKLNMSGPRGASLWLRRSDPAQRNTTADEPAAS